MSSGVRRAVELVAILAGLWVITAGVALVWIALTLSAPG
jgi:hypothetical protein